jgi:hypothetical protein
MARSRRDVQRWARRGTTGDRGYGHAHRTERERRLAMWRPGDPCARCGQPMWHLQRWSKGRLIAAIHLGHTADRTGYTGLEHDQCNESEAATRGNRMRGRARAWASARRW